MLTPPPHTSLQPMTSGIRWPLLSDYLIFTIPPSVPWPLQAINPPPSQLFTTSVLWLFSFLKPIQIHSPFQEPKTFLFHRKKRILYSSLLKADSLIPPSSQQPSIGYLSSVVLSFLNDILRQHSGTREMVPQLRMCCSYGGPET